MRSRPSSAILPALQKQNDEVLIRRAIELARDSVRTGGGPFGALVVRDGRVLAEGQNRVTVRNDPTAHAEIVAIREACQSLGSFRLEGCTIYASCEPCPMCLAAIYWSRAERLVFACTRGDAARAGFDDERIYREIAGVPDLRKLSTAQLLREEGQSAFTDWSLASERQDY